MAYSLTQSLQSLGIPAEMGKELQRQMEAGSFSAQHLMYAGWSTELSRYMATTLGNGTFKASVATELSMIPAVANLISGGGGLPGINFTKEIYSTWVSGLSSTGCVVEDLGFCSDGSNRVYGLRYGDSSKPVLFLVGVLHGLHEWPNAYILRQFMSYLVNPPASAALQVSQILAQYQVYCIPCANPFGYINNDYKNANGVNLNRNFNAFWEIYDDDGEPGTKGTAPFSEIETQIVRDKVLALKPCGFTDFHIWGNHIGSTLEVQPNSDLIFWDPLVRNELYTKKPPLPQAMQWARTVNATNGHKPMTATYEAGQLETAVSQSSIIFNFLLRWGTAMVSQFANGWPQGPAQSITIQPGTNDGTDTQISAAVPDGNYGRNLQIGVGNSTGIRRGLLVMPFSLSSGRDIQSATLTLNCESEDNATDYAVQFKRALKQWYAGQGTTGQTPSAGVDASTWNNRDHNGTIAWGSVGGQNGVDYASINSASTLITGVGSFTFDVTEDIQAFVSGLYQNFGWFLINSGEITASSRKLFTSANGTADIALRPKVEIIYK